VWSDTDGAESVGGPVVGAEELGGGCRGGYRHGGIIVGRFFPRWEWFRREPFVGVFRNGISSIMGGLGWIGVLLRIWLKGIDRGSELGSARRRRRRGTGGVFG
jgi:hypothetical protein